MPDANEVEKLEWRLDGKLDLQLLTQFMRAVGMPLPDTVSAAAEGLEGTTKRRLTGFKLDRGALDEAFGKVALSLDHRIRIKSALAELGVLQ